MDNDIHSIISSHIKKNTKYSILLGNILNTLEKKISQETFKQAMPEHSGPFSLRDLLKTTNNLNINTTITKKSLNNINNDWSSRC